MRHRGEKANALRGKSGGEARVRTFAVVVLAVAALSLPLTAIANDNPHNAFVDPSLLTSAQQNPGGVPSRPRARSAR